MKKYMKINNGVGQISEGEYPVFVHAYIALNDTYRFLDSGTEISGDDLADHILDSNTDLQTLFNKFERIS